MALLSCSPLRPQEAIDLIFIPVYGITLHLSIQMLAPEQVGRVLQVLVVITCVADYFEDADALLLTDVMSLRSNHLVAGLSVVATAIKFAGLFVNFSAIVVLVIANKCNTSGYETGLNQSAQSCLEFPGACNLQKRAVD